ncbi:hypothetical protein FB45DRAFT_1021722 [Roridomyces roridus]|uniref:Uncharacterized protein n=1 Tax=Roridomyces roridus TaxID=1738132 RepID=A0AAD7FY01_9AGAR|nr:hypothetical protein FB45DRAFT_1021722 [Roridomyces roridus]
MNSIWSNLYPGPTISRPIPAAPESATVAIEDPRGIIDSIFANPAGTIPRPNSMISPRASSVDFGSVMAGLFKSMAAAKNSSLSAVGNNPRPAGLSS